MNEAEVGVFVQRLRGLMDEIGEGPGMGQRRAFRSPADPSPTHHALKSKVSVWTLPGFGRHFSQRDLWPLSLCALLVVPSPLPTPSPNSLPSRFKPSYSKGVKFHQPGFLALIVAVPFAWNIPPQQPEIFTHPLRPPVPLWEAFPNSSCKLPLSEQW